MPMATASSSTSANPLEVHGSVTPGPVRDGGVGLRTRPQKLFPEQAIELPRVLQHPGYRPMNLPTSARSGCRTQLTTPTYAPPLIVRSMVVTPRSPSRLRSVSAHHTHTRQKSAMGYASVVHSPSFSMKTETLPSTLWSNSTPACMSACDQIIAADVQNLASESNNWQNRSGSVTALAGNLLARQSYIGKEERTNVQNSTGAAMILSKSNSQEGKNDGRTNEYSDDTERASDTEGEALDVVTEGGNENLKKPSCRRNLAKELERELTFRPELNQRSLKIASRSTRQCVPLVCRLTERRKKTDHSRYSFAPRINPHSVKLAQERAGKIDEVCCIIMYVAYFWWCNAY